MKFAVITAGGSGKRMKSHLPKQFIEIDSLPVIIHTILRFIEAEDHDGLIVTLPEEFFDDWKRIKETHLPNLNIRLVAGGANRFLSVKNALNAIEAEDGLVAVHDAVRPFIPKEVIQECYASATERGSGVVAIPLRDSIRKMEEHKSVARDRSKYRLMQTPQTFQLKRLRDLYNTADRDDFTDDASVWEYGGNVVNLVDGSNQNIKITYPEDIPVAEAIYKFQANSSKER